MEISVSELIRRKIADPPTDDEILLLRRLKEEIKDEERRGRKTKREKD